MWTRNGGKWCRRCGRKAHDLVVEAQARVRELEADFRQAANLVEGVLDRAERLPDDMHEDMIVVVKKLARRRNEAAAAREASDG